MKRLIYLSPAVMLACLNGFAQQPTAAFTFRSIVAPGMAVGGHTFAVNTTIDSAALGDGGEAAFLARWLDPSGAGHAAVFTSKRVVAREGDLVDGKYIVVIAKDSLVAINASGQVAFDALYCDNEAAARDGKAQWGIFSAGHLVFRPDYGKTRADFSLTDDGQVVVNAVVSPVSSSGMTQTPQRMSISVATAAAVQAAQAAQKKPGIWERIPKQPKILPQFPFPIIIKPPTPPATQPSTQLSTQQSPWQGFVTEPASLPNSVAGLGMRTNARGQILIPVNFETGGFMLLLGTPTAQ